MTDQDSEKSAEIEATSNMVASVLNWIGNSLRKNGWPTTLLILGGLFFWHIWSKAEPIAWTVVDTHLKTITSLTDDYKKLVEGDTKRTDMLSEIIQKNDAHLERLDEIKGILLKQARRTEKQTQPSE